MGDFNLIQDNSAYVQNWSIAQALVVCLCTAVQVYFVKSFFKDPREGKSGEGSGCRRELPLSSGLGCAPTYSIPGPRIRGSKPCKEGQHSMPLLYLCDGTSAPFYGKYKNFERK